jgi:hypothetical protein
MMPLSEPHVVIFLYNRLFDPLIQGNFWLYIRDLLDNPLPGVRFHLVTYEDPSFPLTAGQRELVTHWQQQGLDWTALTWHPGTGLSQKLKDVLSGWRVLVRLRRQGVRFIITLGSVAGSYGYLYGRSLGMRLFLYQFEPHSEYAIDNGMWHEGSLQHRLAAALERKAARYASVIASGTQYMQERLQQVWHAHGRFVKIPTVANDRQFHFDPALRQQTRHQLGLSDDTPLLLYPGKFGGLYYRSKTAWMFRWLHELNPRLRFLIVTPHSDSEVHALFDEAHVPRDTYRICHSDYPEIHGYYFAADFAIIAVPPGPSKKFISNIKVGEYLCAGLPFLITRGVSEDHLVAEQQDVGVVVDDFVESEIKAAWPKIQAFLAQPPEQRRAHCRAVGLDYRGFDTLNPRFRSAVETLISK